MNAKKREQRLAVICYLKKRSATDPETLFLKRDADQRDFQYGMYIGVGGKIKDGERPEQAVLREVFEETGGETIGGNKGLHVHQPMYKGVLVFDNQGRVFSNGLPQPDWYVHAFVAHRFSGEMGSSKEGSLVWVPHSQLDQIAMWEGDRIFLPWLERSEIFSARFRYDDKKLTSYDATFYAPSGNILEEKWER